MKYIDDYRNSEIVEKLIEKIANLSDKYSRQIVLMEVCGTHTMAISRSGLRKLLPSKIMLVSGPGCPVCVTPNNYLDKAIAYCKRADVIITTFGDMIRVPGSSSSLEKQNLIKGNVKIVYSPLEALKLANNNPDKKIIFLAVGFETTAPALAATVKVAEKESIKNYYLFCGHKLIPPVMKALLDSNELHIDGFICPGHVSTIIGSTSYEFIAEKYNIPCVITGFEPFDIVQGIYMLISQIINNKGAKVEIEYSRVVSKQGNIKAQKLISELFTVTDSQWRGIGTIPDSGLKISDKYSKFDIEKELEVEIEQTKEDKNCICGEILRGVKTPLHCPLFKEVCTPENPIGACMVSSEGTCAAYYKYEI